MAVDIETGLQGVSRRRVLSLFAHGLLAAAVGRPALAAAPSPVVVLTAYPEEVMARFEAAFEQAHPEYRLRLLWRMPHDALPYLRQPRQGGVDVYWSASPRTFAQLAAEGRLQPLAIDRSGLPDHVGGAALADPAGRFTATEMAGYGFVVNDAALGPLGVKSPDDWAALADPRLAGRIVLPNPARVGFAPVLVDIVLQAYGWEKGWALWSEIAGLATWVDSGGTFVSDEVGSGRAAVGVSIDFFVVSAIANGAPLRFIYPSHGGINPAHIAITAEAANPEGARAFAAFVLSESGQRILAHADIRKLPVRPAVYSALPPDYHDPFAAAARGAYDYDGVASRDRLPVVASVFEQMLVQGHDTLAGLWARIHAAEARGRDVSAARKRLCAPLLSEHEAGVPNLHRRFRARLEGTQDQPRLREEIAWQWSAAKARAAVRRLLEEAGA
ncbi:extracellular solute-binding protein [Azoarcus sp. L1K30]|uniref:ABC transporter substrate-binding protein n=1 Tax=Azoarcus sp. L1K30 TaxID=2820277 RepID=UPI0032C224D4